jgi:hypothetical protein
MTERVNIIVSDGTNEGTFQYNVIVLDMATFTIFMKIVEDNLLIPGVIDLDNVMMWLWNTQLNQRSKLWVIALGTILTSDLRIGLPILHDYVEDGNNFLWTEWTPHNYANQCYELLVYRPCTPVHNWMHNQLYRQIIINQYVAIHNVVNMSLKEVEIMCKYLIYRGTENCMPKNTTHIRFRFETPVLTAIVQQLLGRYGECDDI